MDLPNITRIEADEIVETSRFPRVTLESIRAKIRSTVFSQVNDQEIVTGTLCIIVMKNGWVSTGFSAVVDKRNFDAAVGMRYAFDDALRPLWQLEAYLLKDAMARSETL